MTYQRNIILHVPHARTLVPHELRLRPLAYSVPRVYDGLPEILDFSRPFIDYYTDLLFIPNQPNENVRALVFPYNRAICDVERLPNDPLEDIGFGIVYNFFPKKWPLTKGYCRSRGLQLYQDHRHALEQMIVQAGDNPLLISCHAFSKRPNPLCPDPGVADICISCNDDQSRPSDEVLYLVDQYFRDKGYTVRLNTPFGYAMTLDTDVPYHSLRIAVCKSLYMDEDTLNVTDGFARLQADLQNLYKYL